MWWRTGARACPAELAFGVCLLRSRPVAPPMHEGAHLHAIGRVELPASLLLPPSCHRRHPSRRRHRRPLPGPPRRRAPALPRLLPPTTALPHAPNLRPPRRRRRRRPLPREDAAAVVAAVAGRRRPVPQLWRRSRRREAAPAPAVVVVVVGVGTLRAIAARGAVGRCGVRRRAARPRCVLRVRYAVRGWDGHLPRAQRRAPPAHGRRKPRRGLAAAVGEGGRGPSVARAGLRRQHAAAVPRRGHADAGAGAGAARRELRVRGAARRLVCKGTPADQVVLLLPRVIMAHLISVLALPRPALRAAPPQPRHAAQRAGHAAAARARSGRVVPWGRAEAAAAAAGQRRPPRAKAVLRAAQRARGAARGRGGGGRQRRCARLRAAAAALGVVRRGGGGGGGGVLLRGVRGAAQVAQGRAAEAGRQAAAPPCSWFKRVHLACIWNPRRGPIPVAQVPVGNSGALNLHPSRLTCGKVEHLGLREAAQRREVSGQRAQAQPLRARHHPARGTTRHAPDASTLWFPGCVRAGKTRQLCVQCTALASLSTMLPRCHREGELWRRAA